MNGKRQRIYTAAMASFMILVLFLTFFSKTIYRGNLPIVTVVFSAEGEFVDVIEGRTVVGYSSTHNLYAEYSGKVREVYVSAGDMVKKGDALMTVQLEEGGEYAEFVSLWSGKVLEVGVEEGMYVDARQNVVLAVIADISNRWEVSFWTDRDINTEENCLVTVEVRGMNEEIQGSIAAVTFLPGEDGMPGYLVTVAFTYGGTDIAGKTAEVTIRSEGRYYDTILPKQALQRDATGYYVLTLREENSILGNNYIVGRVSVDLLDEDGIAVALMGVMEQMPVILPDEQQVSPGDRVRY